MERFHRAHKLLWRENGGVGWRGVCEDCDWMTAVRPKANSMGLDQAITLHREKRIPGGARTKPHAPRNPRRAEKIEVRRRSRDASAQDRDQNGRFQ